MIQGEQRPVRSAPFKVLRSFRNMENIMSRTIFDVVQTLMAAVMLQTDTFPLKPVHLFLLKCAVTLHYMSINWSVHKRPWPTSSFLAVQSELEPRQPAVLVVLPQPGTASGRPVPTHSLRASRLPTAYANVHMFVIALSSYLPWTHSCYSVICHPVAIKTQQGLSGL